MFGLVDRTQRAAADISEALSVLAPAPAPAAPSQPPAGVTTAPLPPQLAQPQGALGASPGPAVGSGPGGMPMRRPGVSPLPLMADFKSPPMAAALQGAQGAQGPIGFARGGLAVFGGRDG